MRALRSDSAFEVGGGKISLTNEGATVQGSGTHGRTHNKLLNRPVYAVGELDVCDICDSSPHSLGCPRHPDYNDERISYTRLDAPEEIGPARYWVEDTFAVAARDAGEDEESGLREAISEVTLALKRGDLPRR